MGWGGLRTLRVRPGPPCGGWDVLSAGLGSPKGLGCGTGTPRWGWNPLSLGLGPPLNVGLRCPGLGGSPGVRVIDPPPLWG